MVLSRKRTHCPLRDKWRKLPFRIERSQLRGLRHFAKDASLRVVFQICLSERRLQGRRRTQISLNWSGNAFGLSWGS